MPDLKATLRTPSALDLQPSFARLTINAKKIPKLRIKRSNSITRLLKKGGRTDFYKPPETNFDGKWKWNNTMK